MSARWEAFLGRGFVDFACLPSGTMSWEEMMARTVLKQGLPDNAVGSTGLA